MRGWSRVHWVHWVHWAHWAVVMSHLLCPAGWELCTVTRPRGHRGAPASPHRAQPVRVGVSHQELGANSSCLTSPAMAGPVQRGHSGGTSLHHLNNVPCV